MGSDLLRSPTSQDISTEKATRSSSSPPLPVVTPAAAAASTAAAQVNPEDDWAGLCDRQERRRRQNRLNQRAYRKRKQAERNSNINNALVTRSSSSHPPPALGPNTKHEQTSPPSSSSSSSSSTTTSSSPSSQTLITRRTLTSEVSKPENIRRIFEHFARVAYESYFRGSPSADHLLTLSKLNVFRAFMTNMTVLGFGNSTTWCDDDDALSLFNTLPPEAIQEKRLPVSLRPTKIQMQVPHHPWLDFFPLPRLRDNLCLMIDRFDDDELCHDVMGFWDNASDTCSLLVWGEPSDPANWEVTEQFLRKWPWVLRGCPELLKSTNRWRQKRGEKMIIRYL
ncbi:DUF3425 domain-containing protein [Aspergillus luchuensis]|uniref:Similar to An14g03300 n=1 Tax=Aspergillus kawachii TaxID=1069201 RepID=A0A146FGS5_ASPKA|nr:uncharacterized protein AKAW2_41015S [Aspergillus luchuensis]BCR99332.1 hypothetical protein AKAW2_41015S [Aspergillus luchuensis]BCS11634.1 hypothetical protein ALUC_40974S [Aspergillus luchuensis]GAA86974.1 similar to An14g03300 [Aspergillus luchuensis IFO 4308]GAT25076.1 similar to An14g03300 [Aspergillus luchuensis]